MMQKNIVSNQEYEFQLNNGIIQAKRGNYEEAIRHFLELIRINKINYKA